MLVPYSVDFVAPPLFVSSRTHGYQTPVDTWKIVHLWHRSLQLATPLHSSLPQDEELFYPLLVG